MPHVHHEPLGRETSRAARSREELVGEVVDHGLVLEVAVPDHLDQVAAGATRDGLG